MTQNAEENTQNDMAHLRQKYKELQEENLQLEKQLNQWSQTDNTFKHQVMKYKHELNIMEKRLQSTSETNDTLHQEVDLMNRISKMM